MTTRPKPADGCLFIGSTLHNHTEFVTIEFGDVRFRASVLSRSSFRVDGTVEEVLALDAKLVVGFYAPLFVAAKYFGNAYLDRVDVVVESPAKAHANVFMVHYEVMPP